MSDVTVTRASPFASSWPWPGLLLLLILGAWFGYMGTIAETEDVKSAFYGLAGVTGLLLLLGLRTIGRRPAQDARVVPVDATVSDGAVKPAPDFDPIVDMPERGAGDRARRATQPKAGEIYPSGNAPDRLEELAAEVSSLTSTLTRERADRGAAIDKIEADLDELKKAVADLAVRPPGTVAPEGDFVTRRMLNQAINQRLMPNIEERMTARIAEATAPERLREQLGAGATSDDADVIALRADVEGIRATAQQALEAVRTAGTSGSTGEGDGAGPVGQRLNELKARIDEVAERADAGLQKAAGQVEEMRGNVLAVTEHIARMGEHYHELIGRLDALGAASGSDEGDALKAEVGAMRAALETIIDQNRQIQARQEVLTARFEAPTSVATDRRGAD